LGRVSIEADEAGEGDADPGREMNPYKAATGYLSLLCYPRDDEKRRNLADALGAWYVREARKQSEKMREASRTPATRALLDRTPTRTMFNRLIAGNQRLHYRMYAADLLCFHGMASIAQTRKRKRKPEHVQAQHFWLQGFAAGKFPPRPDGLVWNFGTLENPSHYDEVVSRKVMTMSYLVENAATDLKMTERSARRSVLEESRPVLHLALALTHQWSKKKDQSLGTLLADAPAWAEQSIKIARALQTEKGWQALCEVSPGLATTDPADLIRI
jgi:hypothetical protein